MMRGRPSCGPPRRGWPRRSITSARHGDRAERVAQVVAQDADEHLPELGHRAQLALALLRALQRGLHPLRQFLRPDRRADHVLVRLAKVVGDPTSVVVEPPGFGGAQRRAWLSDARTASSASLRSVRSMPVLMMYWIRPSGCVVRLCDQAIHRRSPRLGDPVVRERTAARLVSRNVAKTALTGVDLLGNQGKSQNRRPRTSSRE